MNGTRYRTDRLVSAYLLAKEHVIRAGYSDEIDWQDTVRFENCTEQDFLREVAWVVLSSGMRELIVRKHFPAIARAFLNWESAAEICRKRAACRREALVAFGHRPKIDAIISAAQLSHSRGFGSLNCEIGMHGVEVLRRIPFIGPVTVCHLAKNLGMDVVKPDRHLCRIAKAVGFDRPVQLCELLASAVGDRMATIDLVLWRFATLRRDYFSVFQREYPDDCQRRSHSRQVFAHNR